MTWNRNIFEPIIRYYYTLLDVVSALFISTTSYRHDEETFHSATKAYSVKMIKRYTPNGWLLVIQSQRTNHWLFISPSSTTTSAILLFLFQKTRLRTETTPWRGVTITHTNIIRRLVHNNIFDSSDSKELQIFSVWVTYYYTVSSVLLRQRQYKQDSSSYLLA